jgi:hypothetical protein
MHDMATMHPAVSGETHALHHMASRVQENKQHFFVNDDWRGAATVGRCLGSL